MNHELDDIEKQHAYMCEAMARGEDIYMDVFMLRRQQLHECGDASRITTSLREVPIRHLLPEEPIDVDVELAELTAAYGAWQTALVKVHLRVRAGENVPLDDPAMVAAKVAYERHDFAKRRVDAIMYGWKPPTTYVTHNLNDYRL